MGARSSEHLSRRERQIMDVIYRRGSASVAEVMKDLGDARSYSTVRALMGILEEKGHLKHWKEGARFVYRPTKPQRAAARSALRRVLKTFFNGSTEDAMAALLDASDLELPKKELDRMAKMIEKAKNVNR